MLRALNHFTIAATDIEAHIRFYQDILGLTQGKVLEGAEPGAYFYLALSDTPVVHVVDQSMYQLKKDKDFRLEAKAVEKRPEKLHTGALDHIAFTVDMADFDHIKQRFEKQGYPYREGYDLMPRMKQIWALDPSGNKIELNFS